MNACPLEMKAVEFLKRVAICLAFVLQGCTNAGAILLEPPNGTLLNGYERFLIIPSTNSYTAEYEVNLLTQSSAISGATVIPPKGNIDSLIKQALESRGKSVDISSNEEDLLEGTVVVRYTDFWGWDFADILKFAKVSFYLGSAKDPFLTVAYHQAYGYHGYPTAAKHVPRLIARAFGESP